MSYDVVQKISDAELAEFLQSGAIIGERSGRLQLAWQPLGCQSSVPEGEPALFFPDFFLQRPDPWWRWSRWAQMEKGALLTQLKGIVATVPAVKWQEPEFEVFSTAFDKIQSHIHRGIIKKAVPVVFAQSEAEVTVHHKAYFLQQLLASDDQRWVYGCWQGSQGMMGLTPELLCEVNGPSLMTMALAGTHPVEAEKELLKDEKELKEHRLVIEDLKDRLSVWGEPKVHETRSWRLEPVVHLRTDLEVLARKNLDVVQASLWLHPTPALGLAPRSVPWQWLKELPGNLARGSFGAPFVWRKPDGSGRALVAIRALQWQNGILKLGSGCGIVAESQIEKEWEELKLKRRSVLKVFGL